MACLGVKCWRWQRIWIRFWEENKASRHGLLSWLSFDETEDFPGVFLYATQDFSRSTDASGWGRHYEELPWWVYDNSWLLCNGSKIGMELWLLWPLFHRVAAECWFTEIINFWNYIFFSRLVLKFTHDLLKFAGVCQGFTAGLILVLIWQLWMQSRSFPRPWISVSVSSACGRVIFFFEGAASLTIATNNFQNGCFKT